MLADHVEKNGLEGKLKYTLFVGASSGAETENRWAALNMIERRSPHQVGKQIAKGINNGNIKFFDKHLSMFPVDLVYVGSPPVSTLWTLCGFATHHFNRECCNEFPDIATYSAVHLAE